MPEPLDFAGLTPTQELVLDTLHARTRTGERVWTFSTRHSAAIDALKTRGIVTSMHGIIEKTVRVSLTGRAAVELGKGIYISPIEEENKALRGKIADMKEQRRLELAYSV